MSSPITDDEGELFGEEEDGLFGDEDENKSEVDRRLSDEELDSGDDLDRDDRVASHQEEAPPQELAADCEVPRQNIPRPMDGELHLFRLPTFLGIDPKEFSAFEFVVPETSHHMSTKDSNFSANNIAKTTIRYRKGVEGQLESNAVFNKWSDGTYTLLLGDTHYVLEDKALAPSMAQGEKYRDHLDSHQYLATPYFDAQVLHIVGHVTNQFTVRPNKEIEDQALAKLESRLIEARSRGKDDEKNEIEILSRQDPELQKKEQEEIEKHRLRELRRKENLELRLSQQGGRTRGMGTSGLNVNDMDRGGRLPGSKKKRSAPSAPRRARRRADYSTDEDDMPRGKHRDDEYDLEDDFVAPSDEDGEEGDGGDDSEEEEESEEESPRAKKQKVETKKTSEVDSDMDAEGEIDDAVPVRESSAGGDAAASRGRRRLVIEDDEDE